MPDNPLEIATKVNSLFQVIMQAVQTYLKNVEMFIYNSSPDKLSVLVDFIANATRICLDKLVFDKNDLTIRDLLRKCSMLRKFLVMNQHTPVKFVTMSDKQRTFMYSKNSFVYRMPSGVASGSRLSMYGDPMTKRKSPYDPVLSKPKNLKCSSSQVCKNSRVNKTTNSTRLRRSSSNVSTMMGRLRKDDEDDLKESDSELEVMKMLKKISQEKLEEMLKPLISELIPMQITNGPRVTSDIDASIENRKPLTMEKSVKSTRKLENPVNENSISIIKEEALRERLNYIQQMMENPLYVNQTIPEPWRLFARIADNLLEEMLDEIISELDFGEKSFVENFLKSELQC